MLFTERIMLPCVHHPFLLGGVEPPTKFSKWGGGGGLDKTSTFRGGLLGKRRDGDLFQGGLQFLHEK